MSKIEGLSINEAEYELQNGEMGKIAVLIYSGDSDPSVVLDNAVRTYVENHGYHELIDANLDNPWMRVIISDINNMRQEKFDTVKHRLISTSNS